MRTAGILGIDPGKTGALVLLSPAGSVLRKEVVPTTAGEVDLRELARLFFEVSNHVELAFLEKVHAMPGQGVTSMFSFGRTFGALQAMLAAFRIPYELVSPRKWASLMHSGTSPELDPKARSRLVAERLFPDLDLRATDRCRIPHEGIVDALLLAEYGRRVTGAGRVGVAR